MLSNRKQIFLLEKEGIEAERDLRDGGDSKCRECRNSQAFQQQRGHMTSSLNAPHIHAT